MKKALLAVSMIFLLSTQAHAYKLLTCLNEKIGFTISTADEPYFSRNTKNEAGEWTREYATLAPARSAKTADCPGTELNYIIPELPGSYKACLYPNTGSGFGEMTDPKTGKKEKLECFAYDLKD